MLALAGGVAAAVKEIWKAAPVPTLVRAKETLFVWPGTSVGLGEANASVALPPSAFEKVRDDFSALLGPPEAVKYSMDRAKDRFPRAVVPAKFRLNSSGKTEYGKTFAVLVMATAEPAVPVMPSGRERTATALTTVSVPRY